MFSAQIGWGAEADLAREPARHAEVSGPAAEGAAGGGPAGPARATAAGGLWAGALLAGALAGAVFGAARLRWVRRAASLAEARRELERQNSELSRAVHLLGLQRSVASAMGEALTMRAFLEQVAELILRAPGVDCCGIYLADETGKRLELALHRGISDAYAKAFGVYHSHCPYGEQVLAGQSVWLDHEAMRRASDPATIEEGLRSIVIVPVKHRARVVASLHASSHAAAELAAETKADLEALAVLMGGAVTRLKTIELLRQSEERFRMIVEHAGVSMMVVNAAGDVIYDNVSAHDSENLAQDGRERHDFEEGLAQECGRRYQGQIRQVLETNETLEFLSRLMVDSEPRWFDITMQPFSFSAHDARVVLIMTKDISDKRKTWEALQESEANFRNLTENAMDAIFILDRHGRFVYANRQFEALSGYSQDDVRLKPLTAQELLPPSQRGWIQERFEARIAGLPVPSRYEAEILGKDGQTVPIELVANRIAWHNETCVLVSARDISERRVAENALKESEALFKSVAEGAFDAIVLADAQGRFLYVSPQLSRMCGYAAEELQGSTFERLVPPVESRPGLTPVDSLPEGGPAASRYETVLRRKDGSSLPVEVSVKEIEWRGQRAFVGVYRDASERKRMELEILKIDEWEKTRIGQDLHDSIGQQLVGMTYLLEALGHDLKKARSAQAAAAAQITDVCRTSHQQLRDIVLGLLPLAVDEGLAAGLNRLAENVRARMKVSCVLRVPAGVKGLNASEESHLYQIAQEAVANAVRHGNAREIVIALETDGDSGLLRIDDDGCGFDVDGKSSSGSGLKIMRYRADLLRGALSVRRRDSGGMSVCCPFKLTRDLETSKGDAT